MRGFLLSIIGVVILSLLVEVICPIKKMKGSVALSFSLVVLVILVGGVRNLFREKTEFQFGNYVLNIDESSEGMMSESVTLMEGQIEKALRAHGCEVLSVDIEYFIDELKIEIEGVSVKTADENMDTSEVKNIVKKIVEVEEDKIWVR